jgi:hypothetical protein
MEAEAQQTTTAVTVFTRHTPRCSRKDDRYYKGKGRDRRKYLHAYEGGRDRTVSSKTRPWEQAEKLAAPERARRDPAKLLIETIAAEEAQRIALRKSKNITIPDATDRWLRSQRRNKKEPRLSVRLPLLAIPTPEDLLIRTTAVRERRNPTIVVVKAHLGKKHKQYIYPEVHPRTTLDETTFR